MKSYLWYYHFPGAPYAYGPIEFDNPVTEREARKHLRELEKVECLPRGTKFWPTTEEDVRIVGNSG